MEIKIAHLLLRQLDWWSWDHSRVKYPDSQPCLHKLTRTGPATSVVHVLPLFCLLVWWWTGNENTSTISPGIDAFKLQAPLVAKFCPNNLAMPRVCTQWPLPVLAIRTSPSSSQGSEWVRRQRKARCASTLFPLLCARERASSLTCTEKGYSHFPSLSALPFMWKGRIAWCEKRDLGVTLPDFGILPVWPWDPLLLLCRSVLVSQMRIMLVPTSWGIK